MKVSLRNRVAFYIFGTSKAGFRKNEERKRPKPVGITLVSLSDHTRCRVEAVCALLPYTVTPGGGTGIPGLSTASVGKAQ